MKKSWILIIALLAIGIVNARDGYIFIDDGSLDNNSMAINVGDYPSAHGWELYTDSTNDVPYAAIGSNQLINLSQNTSNPYTIYIAYINETNFTYSAEIQYTQGNGIDMGLNYIKGFWTGNTDDTALQIDETGGGGICSGSKKHIYVYGNNPTCNGVTAGNHEVLCSNDTTLNLNVSIYFDGIQTEYYINEHNIINCSVTSGQYAEDFAFDSYRGTLNETIGYIDNIKVYSGKPAFTLSVPPTPPTNYGWTPTGNFIYDFVFGYGSAFAGQALASLAVTIGVLLLIGIELFKYAKKK
jgi:hypothetical protein